MSFLDSGKWHCEISNLLRSFSRLYTFELTANLFPTLYYHVIALSDWSFMIIPDSAYSKWYLKILRFHIFWFKRYFVKGTKFILIFRWKPYDCDQFWVFVDFYIWLYKNKYVQCVNLGLWKNTTQFTMKLLAAIVIRSKFFFSI